jgi:hypothetical protein
MIEPHDEHIHRESMLMPLLFASYENARHRQAWRLRTKIVTKFMSYVLQTPRLQKPENSRIV